MDTNWDFIIKNEYEKVKAQKEKQISEIWNNNRAFVNNQNDAKKSSGLSWKIEKGKNKEFCSGKNLRVTQYDAEYEKTQTAVQSIMLPTVTPIPLMNTWLPIPRNFVSNDSKKLERLPYIDGDVIDDAFIEDLVKTYDGNWSGAKTEGIDDDLFVNLVQELSKYQNTMNPMLQSTSSQATEQTAELPFPNPIIFQSISSHFNGNYSLDKYLNLTKQSLKTCTPNIDEPLQMKKHLEPDQSLHSYRKLLCRRCFIYNCQLHSDYENDIAIPSRKQHNFEELKPFSVPCSNTCYRIMNEKTKDIENVPAAAESQNITPDTMNETPNETIITYGEWNFSDQSMLLVLLKVFPNNCCAIAEAMFKSCHQVYQKIQSTEIKHDPEKKKDKKEQKIKNTADKLKHLAKTYKPCDHKGSCHKNSDCLCLNCEKFCGCGTDCRKRANNCKCKGSCMIWKCSCYDSHRECDPQICECVSCNNNGLQRNLVKKLVIAASQIHGWGVVVKESCQKNEFIGEYRGEIISLKEAERRGKVYDKEKCTYLFTLNGDTVVDSTRFGSTLRFTNYSKTPNCSTRVMMVNGDHRIGYYASRFIEAGEELTVDYLTHDPTASKEN